LRAGDVRQCVLFEIVDNVVAVGAARHQREEDYGTEASQRDARSQPL
jgi:hypothetical protein